jgi:hypothetical protein
MQPKVIKVTINSQSSAGLVPQRMFNRTVSHGTTLQPLKIDNAQNSPRSTIDPIACVRWVVFGLCVVLGYKAGVQCAHQITSM